MPLKTPPERTPFMLLDQQPDDIGEDLQTVFDELGETETTCLVYRKLSHETRFAYLHSYTPANVVSLERLRNEFGGGEYRLRFRDKEGKYIKQITFQIAQELKPLRPGEPDGKGTDLAALVRELKGGGNDMMPLMMQMMQSQQSQQIALISSMMQSQAQMVAAFAGKPVAPMPEMLLAKLMEQNNPLANLKMLTEMKQLLSPSEKSDDAGGESTLGEKLLTFAPTLLTALTGGGGAGMAGGGGAVGRSGVAEAAAPAVLPAPGPADGQLAPELKSLLVQAAMRDSDPDLYCEVIYDMLGNRLDDLASVVAIVKNPDGLKAILGTVPPETMPWFQRLAEALETFYLGEQAETVAPKAPPAPPAPPAPANPPSTDVRPVKPSKKTPTNQTDEKVHATAGNP